MTMKFGMTFAGGALFLATAVPAVAHHAFSAEFDANLPLKLKGKVSKIEWVNPHAWIHMDASEVVISGEKKALTAPEPWMVEGGTPNTLFRRGITKDSLAIGTEILVEGFQSKDRKQRANGRDLTFPDGRKLFMGSSGTGVPGAPNQ
jgi:hypothetical protein